MDSASIQLKSTAVRKTDLDGPFIFHVYLACCKSDSEVIVRLRQRLEHDNILCCARCDPNAREEAYQSLIKDRVSRSIKCLIYVTDDYLENGDEQSAWSDFEVKKVLEKASRFSRDVVIILKSRDLTKKMPANLCEYTTFDVTKDMLEDDHFLLRLENEVLREPNASLVTMPKQNIGYGSALGYFYGFLRLVLPDFRKRLLNETLANDEEMVKNTVKKMLIIMPESCFCPPKLPTEIVHTGKFVVRVANRAGNESRDYKSSLYKIHDQVDNKDYYFVGELATPLLTMYESYYFGLAGMTLDELFTERDAFYVALHGILSHPLNKECNQQYKLLFWRSDPDLRKQQQVSLYDYLLPIVKHELAVENNMPEEKPGSLETDSADDTANQIQKETFQHIDVAGSNPSAIYDKLLLLSYNLDAKERGHCLIINIKSFDKGDITFQPRRGAENDVAKVSNLFTRLRFNCRVHEELTLPDLEKLLLTTSMIDHTAFNAFVCVFMTHGKLGVVYTSDAKPIRILDIVEYFNDTHCPSLRGKPKMFFIQACQKGIPINNNASSSVNTSSGNNSGTVTSGQTFVGDSDSSINNSIAGQNAELRASVAQSTPENAVQELTLQESTEPKIVEADPSFANIASSDAGSTEPKTIVEAAPSTNIADCQVEARDENQLSEMEWDACVAPTLEAANERNLTWWTGKAVLVPGWPDFLMSYATLPGSAAYRDTVTGSVYIEHLCKRLRERTEIDRALKQVTQGVKEHLAAQPDAAQKNRFQLPFHLTSGMDKLITL